MARTVIFFLLQTWMITSNDIVLKAKQEKARRMLEERYRYYIPTGKGEEFINLIGSNKWFITLFSAANGVGKTAVGVNILANLIWPCGNPYFQHPLFLNWPYPKRIRIVSEPTTVHLTIIKEMYYWFPKGRYKVNKMGKHYEYEWQTDTGWTIDIMTYDQDPKEFESATIGLIWPDEPPPERIYKACISRLRGGGLMFITATPLTGSAWMYDQIIMNKENDEGSRTYLEADVETACRQHGVRGFLEHDNIQRIISQYTEEEKWARIQGKFQYLTGLVFKMFSPKIHIIKPFHVNHADYVVSHALDPHPRTNDAALWVAVDRQRIKYVVDELWMSGLTEELATRIKNKDSQYRMDSRIIDPSAGIEDQHTGKSLMTRLREYDLAYTPATKMRSTSDQRIQDALGYQQVGEEFLRYPELYIFENCERTIYEMTHYRWDDWTGKSADKHGLREKPVDKDDHMIENLGRLLIREPQWYPNPYIELQSETISDHDPDPYN